MTIYCKECVTVEGTVTVPFFVPQRLLNILLSALIPLQLTLF